MQLCLVQLDQVLHLPALAVDGLVEMPRIAVEIGDDVTDVDLLAHAAFGTVGVGDQRGLEPGHDTARLRPALGLVLEAFVTATLFVERPERVSAAQVIGSLGDETWCYYRPDGSQLRVTFVRRTGGFGVSGDMVVTPLMAGEAESAAQLLATDAFDSHDDLEFSFWPAAFRAADRRLTELLLVPDSVEAIAALVDAGGHEVVRDTATGRPLRLVAPPGPYLLLLDAVRGPHTGRYRGTITLSDFSGEEPAVSSILIAAGGAPPARDSLTALAPHRLALPVDQPLRVYAELYNMGRTDGTTRYVAQYRFERHGGSIIRGRQERVITISFERERPFAPRIIESLIVDQGRLPKGHYRLQLEVTDRIRGAKAASATIEFTLR